MSESHWRRTRVETFIVRIYRNEENGPHKIAGIVERPSNSEVKPFVSVEELWEILGIKERDQN
jgi:hypothetical protein